MVKKLSIATIFLIVFMDLLGLGLIIPILPALFVAANGPFHTQYGEIILGLLLASYPIAQFVGAPILGGLSDSKGRRPVMILSLIGTVIGYILFATGIVTQQLWLLFAGRIIDGFTGGNIVIAQSIISDISTPQQKVKRFGLIGMAFGLGFILGPFFGGLLSDSSTVSWFGYATPIWAAAILSLVTVLAAYTFISETGPMNKAVEIHPLTGFKNLARAISMKQLRFIFLSVLLFALGFNFFTQFFQVFLIDKFQVTPKQIGMLFAFMGVCIAITQGFITRFLAKRFTSQQILRVSLLLLSASIFGLLIAPTYGWIFVVITSIAVFNGMTMPNMTNLVSSQADAKSQGEILGMNQAIQSVGQAVPPIIAGFLAMQNSQLPELASCLLIFCAWITILFVSRQRSTFHEVS